jgi:hypothetical protein
MWTVVGIEDARGVLLRKPVGKNSIIGKAAPHGAKKRRKLGGIANVLNKLAHD